METLIHLSKLKIIISNIIIIGWSILFIIMKIIENVKNHKIKKLRLIILIIFFKK